MSDYYKNELSRINKRAETINIKLTDFDGNSTKNLGVNRESIPLLIEFLESLKCQCCDDNGYLEVTHDDGEYIEACQECDYFGIIGEVDELARDKAKADGYKLTKSGKVKE
jgi:hypothetical protein